MTLRAIFTKEKTKSIKDLIPNELVVYKAVLFGQEEDRLLKTTYPTYISPIDKSEYFGGEQSNSWDRAKVTVPFADEPEGYASYYLGFHSFVQKTPAIKFLHKLSDYVSPVMFGVFTDVVLLTCGVLKDWIIAIGIEGERDLVVVSNRIIMPSYPHKDIRYDKNCDWFFEAQSKRAAAKIDLKKKIRGIPLTKKYTPS